MRPSLAENLTHQIGSTVDDSRLTTEIISRRHETNNLQNASDLINANKRINRSKSV